ncbi:MAG: ATP-binding protein, partial [Acidimicrobiia bacterium]
TRIELDEALPTVNADPVQIGQVLVNLVRNAVEAMEGCAEDRRLVTLRTSPLGSGPTGIALTVSDQGMGLPEGDPDRVFENFYTTKTQGMGVGLGICRSIIETHGGKLWAKVNADGGASFQLELPVGEAGTDDN